MQIAIGLRCGAPTEDMSKAGGEAGGEVEAGWREIGQAQLGGWLAAANVFVAMCLDSPQAACDHAACAHARPAMHVQPACMGSRWAVL